MLQNKLVLKLQKIYDFLGRSIPNNMGLDGMLQNKLVLKLQKIYDFLGRSIPNNMGREGIEPPTPRASVVCSPTELPSQ